MHYYKRNLGDYAKKAARLTILQHGVYNLLIDACYDRERFPTRAEAIDWVWASTPEEEQAVDFVLRKFFEMDPETGVYTQSRIAEEIAAYHAKAAVNQRIAQDRERARHESLTKRVRTVSETQPNQEPLTTNQEPQEKKKRVALDYSVWPQQPSEQVMSDWLAMRKRLKADVSQTVINAFNRELQLAVQAGFSVDDCLMECVTSNWRGFKAAWIKGRTPTARHNDFENRNYNAGVTDGTF
jgi:uncharacterized protein YdaU (DUF1376 family)